MKDDLQLGKLMENLLYTLLNIFLLRCFKRMCQLISLTEN